MGQKCVAEPLLRQLFGGRSAECVAHPIRISKHFASIELSSQNPPRLCNFKLHSQRTSLRKINMAHGVTSDRSTRPLQVGKFSPRTGYAAIVATLFIP